MLLWSAAATLPVGRWLFGIVRFSDDPTTAIVVKWPPQYAFEFTGLPSDAVILYADENGIPSESLWLLLAEAWPGVLIVLLLLEIVRYRRRKVSQPVH